jgi:hypothetical protein
VGLILCQHTTNNKKITLKTKEITNQIMVAEKRRSRNNGIDDVNIIQVVNKSTKKPGVMLSLGLLVCPVLLVRDLY